MRHLKAHRKLGRTTEHRMSMLRNLATSLINSQEERIVTTLPKAKELRPFVERAITLSRRARSLAEDDADAQVVHLRRQAAGFFHAGNTQQVALMGKRGQQRLPRTAGVAALKRLFDELGKRYQDRPGGYTRILKLGTRAGDNAELAIIELVGNPRELEAVETAKKRTKTTGVKKKGATEGKGVSVRRGPKPYEKKETQEASEVIEASSNQTEDGITASEPKSSTEDDAEVAS